MTKFHVLLIVLCTVLIATSAQDTKESAFLGWFERNGGKANGVAIRSFEGMGRGVLATERVTDGSEILRIPSKIIFSMQSFHKSEDSTIRKIASMYSKTDEAGVIAAFMVEYCRGRPRSSTSIFRCYQKISQI